MANTQGSITTGLGYTPPANTQGSITTALGYTPTNLGNTIELGTETTGNTDNVSEGSTNKYYTDARVNAAVGSLSVNVHSDSNINMNNEGDFVKIVGGQLVAGSSSVTVAFSEVTGSATSAQLPIIYKLYATTTTPAAGDTFGQLYVAQGIGSDGGGDEYTKLLLHMNNPGTSTFVDSSAYAHTVTVYGDAVGTSTAKFGSGAGYFDGTGDYLRISDTEDLNFGSGNWTIDYFVKLRSLSGQQVIMGTAVSTTYQAKFTFNVDEASYNDKFYMYWDSVANPTLLTTATYTTGIWYHLAWVRNGTSLKLYVDGIEAATATIAAGATLDLGNGGQPFIGQGVDGSPLNGVMDEIRISKGIARWTSNFTPPTAPYGNIHTQYSAKYDDPVNGNTVLEILTPGTTTTEPSYIYCNATTTVWGLGTNTSVTGTASGAYAGWSNRPIRVGGVDIGSTIKIKENVKDIKIKPDLLDAEGIAKSNYIANNKTTWIAANGVNYTTVINKAGTSSTIIVDTESMEADYNSYIELEWAADLNQDAYTENIQKIHEKGFWQMFDSVQPKSWNPIGNPSMRRKGFVVEEMPDVVWGEDRLSIDFGAIIAYMTLAQKTLKADTIFALSTLKELLTTGTVTQQKIGYCNDRLEVLEGIVSP